MSRQFLSVGSRRALTAAARALEEASCAELVIAVRPFSGSYFAADLLAAAVAGWLTLAVLLFSPWDFALPWFLVDPVVVGLLAALATARFAGLRRILTGRKERRRKVETAARSTFLEHHIHRKAQRSGILLYISLLEREVAVVVDVAVEPLASTPAWRQAVEAIAAVIERGGDGHDVASEIHRLAELLAPALVHTAADRQELGEEVCE